MLRHSFTRRRAIQAGAAATAVAALRPPRALARPRPTSFSLALPGAGDRAAAAGGWRTLPITRAPRRFDLLGLRWSGGSVSAVEVRARRNHGAWTPWTALHASLDHGPDAATAAQGTEPCWTGSADVFQLRLRGSVRGLRVGFVRARPAAEFSRRLSARGSARASQAGSQSPPIIARAQWGGDQVPPRADPSYGEVRLAFVHHTVTANGYAPEESASIVLGIAKYHRDHNKWNDLGYNFLVDRHGQIFEGRAGGTELAVIGAQAQGYNSHSTGIACLGTFTDAGLDPAGIESLSRVLAWKLPLHGAPVNGKVTVTSGGGESNRYAYGSSVTFERISGHRDGDSTACPGNQLYDQLAAVRRRAGELAVPLSVLTLAASRTEVRYPSRLLLSGTLRFSDRAPADGRSIEIQHQAGGAGWSPIGETTTQSNGRFSVRMRVPGSGQVRAVFPGEESHPALEASPIAVTILPKLKLSLDPRRGPVGERVEVTGTLGPTWPSRIEVLFERRVGRRWVRVQRKRINVRGGKFRTVVRPERTGLHRVTVRTEGAVVKRRFRAVSVSGGASAH